MARDNYAWWRQRFVRMAQYFDAYRIDHILGFFRIWEIPATQRTGLLGHFYPALPLSTEELASRGVWDIERLIHPYIRRSHLEKQFGAAVDKKVAYSDLQIAQYFDEPTTGVFRLKPAFSTERGIEKACRDPADAAALLSLCQNVALLEDPEQPGHYHPRILVGETDSFKELPDSVRGALWDIYVDFYYHRHDQMWKQEALRRLPPLLASNSMLVCGEDLGMIPHCVEEVMDQLHILGLRVQRMPADPKMEFYHPASYARATVCTPSVHDTSTTRGWWLENPGLTQRYYNQILGQPGGSPATCEPWVMDIIFCQHLESRSLLAVFPLQDLFALSQVYNQRPTQEEQINDPSNPTHYWRYRSHVSVEELLADAPFSEMIAGRIRKLR